MVATHLTQLAGVGQGVSEGPLSDAVSRLFHRLSLCGGVLDDIDHALLEDLCDKATATERELVRQNARIGYLEDLSMTDELTGVSNRRGFRLELGRALARARRLGERGVLLLCDLDGFKAINDTYGHPAGDQVLRSVARRLRGQTRSCDSVGRLGGDEFAVLMTNTTPDQARLRTDLLDREINRLSVEWQGRSIPVSASLGVEAYGKTSRTEDLMALADRALYRDKHPPLLEAV